MMTGAGVSVGGAGMLRTRRRDVSVKPNRKLDRKSSRGMIYENEELRLRTIHINAEVEQGQNDIKKLRRENEQLRREIWSLRDEYDKLEEILKRQQSHEESEEYEDRSEEDDDLQSEYSFEEDERNEEIDEDVQDSEEETNKSEQLENAENQKLSAEKMTSSSQHRLHVDFDDLSVVDEEEEPKKDKDKKELPSEDTAHSKEDKDVLSAVKPRLLHENIPFYPGTYQPQANISSPTYYSDCPFKFPSTLNLMFSPPETPGIINTPCPTINPDPLIPLPNLTSLNMDQVNEHILHAPPVGWQSNFFLPQNQTPTYSAAEVDPSSRLQNFSSTHQDLTRQQSNSSTIGGFTSLPNFLQKRNAGLKLAINPVDSMLNFGNIARSSDRTFAENGLIMNADSLGLNDTNHLHGFPRDSMKMETKDSPPLSGSDKPKHFFAPLPSKLKRQSAAPSPTINHFATGNSSNSSKTDSTVVCKNQFANEKGSADIYVNGAVPSEDHLYKNKSEQRTFLSTGNLLIGEDKSSNPLVKSMSCQDLSSDPQSASINHNDGKQQLLTKSDNTLDSVKSASKPYKTHLTVTLKAPKMKQAASPDTPEIPKLPNIDYRLFKNPFLRTFDPTNNYVDQYNATRPLSIQVSDDNLGYYPQQAEIPILNRGVAIGDRYRSVQSDQNRLLIQSNQLLNGKLMSPVNKHQIQVTSFERPSPHTLIGPASPYDYNTLRRLNTNPYRPPTGQNLYQNMQFMPRGGIYPQRGMLYYENMATKVPAQTQTSIDGDSQHEDEHTLSHEDSAPNTPSGQRKKKMVRKEKGSLTKDHKPLSPAAQRRLRKQSSVTSSEVPPESPVKGPRKKSRRLSVTPTTTSEGQEDKNESRSSSSGQDSPKKDQTRRVSLYFNAKKRPSLTSMKTVRSGSLDTVREKEAMTINSERERTNSVSSRETGSAKARKASTSSGNVPWCACWGNGCI